MATGELGGEPVIINSEIPSAYLPVTVPVRQLHRKVVRYAGGISFFRKGNMNLLTTAAPQTMTSREIAELCDKRHDNVMRVCRELKAEGVCPQIEEAPYIHPANNQEYIEFVLNKRDSLVLVARLSPEFTGRVVDRWLELEASAAPRVPQTMAQALRLAAEQAEMIEQQQAQLEAAAPKVEFVNRYVESTGSKGFREVCKLLQIKEPAFRAFLTERKIMYRLNGEWTPYGEHLNAKRFEIRAGSAEANGHAYNSARFTPKGIAWIAGLWAAHKLEGGAA